MILTPIIIVGCIGLFFGIGLGLASKKLHVHIDPRIEKIVQLLPNANCGACGFPGCGGFAKEVVAGKADPSSCVPGGSKIASQIAEILGVEAKTTEPMMAVVHCKGGINEAKERAVYDGIKDCHAAAIAGNGSKLCSYGCFGLGTCVVACPFNALDINTNGVAVVNNEKCTGCGKCVSVCPRDIIDLIPKVHKIYIACSNHDRGAKVKKYCSVGCTSCSICVKATPSGAITIENNLPILDYSKSDIFIPAAYKCPSKCFVDLVKTRPKANIDTKCDGCGECINVCPIKDAITGEKSGRHVINKDLCIGCGICLDSCHVHAILLWGGLGYNSSDKSKRQKG